ncbi:MAG: hypothetical protein IID18_10270 [Nitrospinae bacterium]|nr:hypothetical protein [Nitrospinota bacterium]
MEIFAGLGAFWLLLVAIAAILLFFLPFYVAGIYNRVRKCEDELKSMHKTLKTLLIDFKQAQGGEEEASWG